MAEPFAHLHPDARLALANGDAARIGYFSQDLWVGYSRALQILQRMEALRTATRVDRMENMLLVGDTDNGKSFLMKRFQGQHKPYETESGLKIPVLGLQAPPVPDERRLYNNILRSLGIPFNPNDSLPKREKQIYELLPDLGIELLMVDEIHHLLAGSVVRQRQFLNVLKLLAIQLKSPMVFAGTREAARALAVDPQMANRFPPTLLPIWEPDQEWQRLLASFEKLLPMPEPSLLASAASAQLLHQRTEGAIGELKKLLLLCLKQAVAQRKTRIDSHLIESIPFVPPSQRRQHAEQRRAV